LLKCTDNRCLQEIKTLLLRFAGDFRKWGASVNDLLATSKPYIEILTIPMTVSFHGRVLRVRTYCPSARGIRD